MSKNKKKKSRNIFLMTVVFVLIFIGILYLGLKFAISGAIARQIEINVGEPVPNVNKFIKSDWIFGRLSDDSRIVDTTKIGEHAILIEVLGMNFRSKLNVVDLDPPKAKANEKKVPLSTKLEAKEFVKEIVDISDVSVTYKVTPDFNKLGEQDVFVILKDEAGNKTELRSKLTTFKDTSPPNFVGIKDIAVYVGSKISYREGVMAVDEGMSIEYDVDSSQVNVNKPGEYSVTYSAVDLAGNKTVKKAKVVVRAEGSGTAPTIDDVNILADQVLARITKPEMSTLQKYKAIYDYISNEIAYVGQETRPGWIIDAYNGMKYKRGDCFNFYAMGKVLIERLGGECLPVRRRPDAKTGHIWLIVKYKDKWYHFDPSNSPTRKGFECFMKSDPEVEVFTKQVYRIIAQYYEYKKSDYPEISTTPIVE